MKTRSVLRLLAAAAALLAATGAAAQHALTGELPKPRGDDIGIVAVAGASGRTGRLVVAELLRTPRFAVRGLTRDPAAATGIEGGDRVQWLQADVRDPASLAKALRGTRWLVSVIGATERSGENGPEQVDYRGTCNLVDAARDAGVDHLVVVSSMGVGEGGFVPWILNLVGGDVLEWKARGEECVRRGGVPYTIIRPGGLRDGAGGEQGLRLRQEPGGLGAIRRADVARVVVAALGNPEAIGKTFSVVADDASGPEAWRSGFRALRRDEAAGTLP